MLDDNVLVGALTLCDTQLCQLCTNTMPLFLLSLEHAPAHLNAYATFDDPSWMRAAGEGVRT